MYLQLATGEALSYATGEPLLLSGNYVMMLAEAICELETTASPQVHFLGEAIAEVESNSAYGGHFVFEANAELVTKVGFSARFVAEAVAELITSVNRYIPERPTQFKAVRDGSTITLTWVDGADTHKVEVLSAVGERESSSVAASVSKALETAMIGADTNTSYTFQLVPIGVTGSKGKASYIVYSTADSNIL